jgi:diguanylate cyclase (GGDEF)-like protein
MAASSVTRRMLARLDFREWAWWELPRTLRFYVAAVPLSAMLLMIYAVARTEWYAQDLAKYLLLLACGLVSVAATPRVAYVHVTRDFITVWMLPVAILLPPVYVMATPIPLLILTQWRISRGVIHRRVFSGAAMAVCYGGASLMFHAIPHSIAGTVIGTRFHALTWVLCVVVAELIGGRGHNLLISGAVKLYDPTVSLFDLQLGHEALQADFAESDLGLLITVVVAVNPVLAVCAIPTVLLIRRFMMHAQLLAQARIDTKTGLLNSSTWETEAAVEVERAHRTGTPLSVALIDIDHFKTVNDTHGHLAGDTVLRAVTDAIREHLRSYDLAGRFGGEEFVVLLPQARQVDAISIAERLRRHVAAMVIPIAEDKPAEQVRLTISVGVASLNEHTRELTDLMAAADAAMYIAKQSGRNRTHAMGEPEGAIVAGQLGAAETPGAANPHVAPARPR